MSLKKLLSFVSLVGCVLSSFGAWYDNPGILKLVPLATGSSTTEDPHYMNKSADDKTLLVDMQAGGDNDGTLLLDMDDLADYTKLAATKVRKVFSKPSAIGGNQFKGGAISSDRNLAILGSAFADVPLLSFAPTPERWTLGANLFSVPAVGVKIDGMDFGTGSTYLYSNVDEGGLLARFNVGPKGVLSGKVTKATSLSRVRNVSLYHVGDKELLYYGEGATTTADPNAKLCVMDVTDSDPANWTETDLGVTVKGDVTNVKLSNEDTATPILYALSNGGELKIWKLAADGLSVAQAEPVKTFTVAQMKSLAGGSTAAKFRNFEVTKDGQTAFLINRKDAQNVSLAVLQALPTAYIEANGNQFLDTGYVLTPESSVYVDYAFMDMTYDPQQFILEGGDSVTATNSSRRAFFRLYNNASGHAWCVGNQRFQPSGIAAKKEERCQVLLDGAGLTTYVRTDTACTVAAVPSYTKAQAKASCSLKLLANYTTKDHKSTARLYGAKVYEGSKLVRDYVPCKRGETVGLYETIEGRFLTSAGLTASSDVQTMDEPTDEPYIQSDGTKTMNLDYFSNPKTRIDLDFELTDATQANKCLIGQYGSDCGMTMLVYLNAGIFQAGMLDGNWSRQAFTPDVALDTNRHVLTIDGPGGRYVLTDEKGNVTAFTAMGTAARTKTATWPMALFGSSTGWNGATQKPAAAKVYRVRIYEDNTLLYDYTPAKQNGVPGLKCAVTGKFLPGPGLTLSANAPEAIEQDPYIESSGAANCFVNTGFIVTDKSKIEVDYAFTDASVLQARLLGNDGQGNRRHSLYINGSGNVAVSHGDAVFRGDSTGIKADVNRHRVVFDFLNRTKAYYQDKTKLAGWTLTAQEMATNFVAVTKAPTMLFGASTSGTGVQANNRCKARIFSAKFWEDGVLVHNFQPCLRSTVPGFKDLVTGKFITGENVAALSAHNVTVIEVDDPALVITGNDQANGARYIDTGYNYTDKTRVELDYALSENYTSAQSGNGDWYLLSGWTREVTAASKTNSWHYALYYNRSQFGFVGGNSGWVGFDGFGGPTTGKDIRRLAILDNAQKYAEVQTAGYVNGRKTYTSVSVGTESVNSIKIAAYNNGKSCYVPVKIYGLKIYEAGELVRDYRPFMHGGQVKLRDVGTGEIHGPHNYSATYVSAQGAVSAPSAVDIAGMRAGDAYVQSDGTQIVNLGYYTKPTTRYEIDYLLLNQKGQQRICGAGSGNTAAGLSVELYVQGTAATGNIAFGIGDTWTGHPTDKQSTTTTRRVAVVDCYHKVCSISGLKSMNITSTCNTTANLPMCLFGRSACTDKGVQSLRDYSICRIYAFRIFEKDMLVHEFLPYKNGSVVGFYDAMTGEVKTNVISGANALVYGGDGCYDYQTNPETMTTLAVKPAEKSSLGYHKSATLKAYAPGAVGYVWKMNGVEIFGETTDELVIDWQYHKGSTTDAERTDTYTVQPVFIIDGVETLGAGATADVVSNKAGLMILVR